MNRTRRDYRLPRSNLDDWLKSVAAGGHAAKANQGHLTEFLAEANVFINKAEPGAKRMYKGIIAALVPNWGKPFPYPPSLLLNRKRPWAKRRL
jgi:hypothetical protein